MKHIIYFVVILIFNFKAIYSEKKKNEAIEIRLSAESRIIGGERAAAGQFPYQVSLQFPIFLWVSEHFCGASIVNKNYLLTAAHCLNDPKVPWNKVEIVAGTNLLSASAGQRRRVAGRMVHPDFDETSLRGDIALLKVDEPLEYNAYVKPLTLTNTNIPINTKCVVSGWGQTHPKIKHSNAYALKYMHVYKLDKNASICKSPKGFVCAGIFEKKGPCMGDSGGPLACKNKLTGIVSFGYEACALEGSPDFYSDVYYFRPWIFKCIKEANSEKCNYQNNGFSKSANIFFSTLMLLIVMYNDGRIVQCYQS